MARSARMPGTRREIAREIDQIVAQPRDLNFFYLTDVQERPLDPHGEHWLGAEFRTLALARRAATRLVQEGAYPRVEVWRLYRGDHYLQGVADEDGWSFV